MVFKAIRAHKSIARSRVKGGTDLLSVVGAKDMDRPGHGRYVPFRGLSICIKAHSRSLDLLNHLSIGGAAIVLTCDHVGREEALPEGAERLLCAARPLDQEFITEELRLIIGRLAKRVCSQQLARLRAPRLTAMHSLGAMQRARTKQG